jgi:rubrerythrin
MEKPFDCTHACRNTCGMLNEAIREESEMVKFYEKMMGECDYPDVQAFIRDVLEERSRSVIRLMQKLNELRARGQILDGVISSFNPTT